MAFNILNPADNQFISVAPAELRENFRALKEDKIVNAGKLNDKNYGNKSGDIALNNGVLNTNLVAQYLGDTSTTKNSFAPAGWIPPVATKSSNGSLSNTDKTKLDSIASGAEVNQYTFANVKVGTNTIQADVKQDTLEFVGDNSITLTANTELDKITFSVPASGHVHDNVVAGGVSGLITGAMAKKLNGIADGAEVNQNTFTTIVAGGKSIVADAKTDTFTVNAGKGITITGDDTNDAMTIAITQDGHTHAVANDSTAGFMGTTEFNKLNGIANNAEVNQMAFSNVKVGNTTIAADSKTDTLELIAGANIALIPNATNDNVTINVTGTVESAKNANTVGGKSAGEFAPSNFGLGTTCKIVTGDWNKVLTTGFYMGHNLTNAPTNSEHHWYFVIVSRHNDLYTCQLAMGFSASPSKMWFRRQQDGAWTAWLEISMSNHTHSYLYGIPDTRSEGSKPNDYNVSLRPSFRLNSVIGKPDTSTFSSVLGLRSWVDSSGGNAHELAFTGNGDLFHRSGATTDWNAWRQIITSDKNPVIDRSFGIGEADWNIFRTAGVYSVNQAHTGANSALTSSNTAEIYNFGTLIVTTMNNGAGVTQMYVSHRGEIAVRQIYPGTSWGAWRRQATTDGNIATATKIKGILATKPATDAPSTWEQGMYFTKVYDNGYPTRFGELLTMKHDIEVTQLLLGWSETDKTPAPLYVRNKRDVGADAFSDWSQIYTSHFSGFTQSLTANGWTKLPNGLILQWGISSSLGGDANATLNFPISFPNACLRAYASISNAHTGGDDIFSRVISYTQTQIVVRAEGTYNANQSGTRYVEYFAIGY